MEYFKTIYLTDYLIQLRDPLGVCISIIKGDKKAIIFDTGYGIGRLKDQINELINTPYIVILSHGHMDHSAGSSDFNEVYLNHEDYKLYLKHNEINKRISYLEKAKSLNLISFEFDENRYINHNVTKVLDINEGDTFDLGSIFVKVIKMEGHTKGSIGLLLTNKEILLVGDGCIHNMWLFLEESLSRTDYIKMLDKVINIPFNYFVTGHLMEMYPKRFIHYYKNVAKSANIKNSKKYESYGFSNEYTYQHTEEYEGQQFSICYDIRK